MRVLVVDDSTIFRKVVRDALAALPGVEVVGSAGDGRRALEKIEQLKPDLVTLDVEMPEMNGLDVLRKLHGRPNPPAVLMVSGLTNSGAAMTAQALRLGAFDFVLKPSAASFDANLDQLRAELLPKIRHLAGQSEKGESPKVEQRSAATLSNVPPVVARAPSTAPVKIVGIGISTGGPASLAKMLPKLPADLPVPIVIVQHMPPLFTRSLADDLNRECRLQVQEAQHGTQLLAGNVYIAPGGRQMKIERTAGAAKIVITDDPPERSCKPAVDYLFRSLADEYGDKVLAIVMTGMGDDGTLGCRLLKRKDARVIAQDQASCVVYGMPRQVVESGLADLVCPLSDIHEAIIGSVRSPGQVAFRDQGGVACL